MGEKIVQIGLKTPEIWPEILDHSILGQKGDAFFFSLYIETVQSYLIKMIAIAGHFWGKSIPIPIILEKCDRRSDRRSDRWSGIDRSDRGKRLLNVVGQNRWQNLGNWVQKRRIRHFQVPKVSSGRRMGTSGCCWACPCWAPHWTDLEKFCDKLH